MEDSTKVTTSARKVQLRTKSAKLVYRSSKQASQTSHSPVHNHGSLSPQCRQRKIKCDGKFPCRRCKDDGLVCTAGTRKKTECKQLPRGYAEMLEHNQLTLIATVHKLYDMVRNGQQWELDEPELNDRGQPIIHNIAALLGCIRPDADAAADLLSLTVLPEQEGDSSELAAEPEVHQLESHMTTVISETDATCNLIERASSPELGQSDSEQDYRKIMMSGQNMQTLSLQNFTSYNSFDTNTIFTDPDASTMFPVQSTYNPTLLPSGDIVRPASVDGVSPQFMQQMGHEHGRFSAQLYPSRIRVLHDQVSNLELPQSEVMLGFGGQVTYSGY
ncbi:hypothetical protein BKA67DRAFT_679617, partial [Truncatella angustata]